jgi:peroxiredoxin
MRVSIAYLMLPLCALSSWRCGGGAAPETASETAAAAFVANPQPVPAQEVKTLELGAPAPDFSLPDVNGRMVSLADFADAPVLCIIFTCNHCPTAQAYEARIKALVDDYRDRGVAVVAISPNSPLGLLYEELGYSDLDDDYESGVIRARDANFNFPYLYDGDTHGASLLYGPVATPHAFVFDQERKLRYAGRIDASEKPGTANAEDLRQAFEALLAGKEVANPLTKTFGCSTKWAWKTEWKEKVDKEWAEKPVNVEMADVEAVKRLLKNEDSGKMRLVNVWATWCGPCIIEYPEFIVMQRMYGARDFEFVSLSADKPEQVEKVEKFLRDKQSATRNLLFSEEDKYALIEAVDPQWDGALPYTVLLAPGGEVVYRKMGAINPMEVRRAIVEHPLMGRYY